MYHSVCMKVRGNLKEWIHSYYVGPRDWTKVIKLYVKNYLEPIPTFFFTYSTTYYMPVICWGIPKIMHLLPWNCCYLFPQKKSYLKNLDSSFPTYGLIATVSICWNRKSVNHFTIFSFKSVTNVDNALSFLKYLAN